MYHLGDTAAVPTPATLDLVFANTQEIIERQKAEESRRRWTLLFTIGGAIFAAVKLGIVAIPHLRKRRAPGQLATVVTNPGSRRRRRRKRNRHG